MYYINCMINNYYYVIIFWFLQVREMKCVCFQAKQVEGFIHRIDIPFHVVPTPCNSKFALEVIIKFFIKTKRLCTHKFVV